ncbi:MAG: hypothetical protein IPJ46_01020 [Anaerolineales bacterium]|nr:hypothetical protein [Anaerolineales bacterium]
MVEYHVCRPLAISFDPVNAGGQVEEARQDCQKDEVTYQDGFTRADLIEAGYKD